MKNKTIVILALLIPLSLVISLSGIFLLRDQNPIDIEAQKIDMMLGEGVAGEDYIPGQVIVQYSSSQIDMERGSGQAQIATLADRYQLNEVDSIPDKNIQLVEVQGDLGSSMKALIKNPAVETVQLNYIYKTTAINTNDSRRNDLWGLENTGQQVNNIAGKIDADIDAPEAWAVNEGTNAQIVVAVVDTGVDYYHPDLVANMWDGSNCKDHEGKPLGGCNHGYDYSDYDKSPLPGASGHGTHVAGTISAQKNNGKGLIGVAPNAKIMAVRSSLLTMDSIKAIDFARHNGAKVINASWGGGSTDNLLKQSIENFPGLFVAAAGNSKKNHAETKMYPCDYNLSNIICVGATDQNDNLADFSDYGVESVDIAAPGNNILSTYPKIEKIVYNFDQVQQGEVPDGWVKSGLNNKWGVKNNLLLGDALYAHSSGKPYDNNANTSLTTGVINLDTKSASIGFAFDCYIQPQQSLDKWSDYLQILYSKDGTNYVNARDPLDHQRPLRLGGIYAELRFYPPYPPYHPFLENLPIGVVEETLSPNFRLRFNWVTDATDNDYDGCAVDNVTIYKYVQDEQYAYLMGTSMASPHVAGLVALVWGYKPDLTAQQVKSIILDTGDSLPALAGKTVTGKRINAYQAMLKAQNSVGASSNTPTPSPSNTPVPTNTRMPVPTNTLLPGQPTHSITPIPTTSISENSCGKADTDGDGKFTIEDFRQFALAYGMGKSTCADKDVDYGPCGGRDANRDGKLDIQDFGVPGIGFAQRYFPKTSCAL